MEGNKTLKVIKNSQNSHTTFSPLSSFFTYQIRTKLDLKSIFSNLICFQQDNVFKANINIGIQNPFTH